MPTWNLSKDIELLMRFWEIRIENGYDFPKDINSFKISCHKSALLRRMLDGKEPLPIPPPRSHSYPWYELIENGVGYPWEVWVPEEGQITFTKYPSIVIDQSPWKIIETLGEDEWIITYPYGKMNDKNEQKFAEGKWHLYAVGCTVPRPINHDSISKMWELKKIE